MYVPRTQKGAFANGVVWIAALFVLAAAITGGVWAWRYVTASTAGKVQARQQIQSGSFRIAAYDHFFDLCASIQGLEGQLDAQLDELATATGDDLARVQANVAGIKGARAQAIADYNADARKGYTLGQFRSSQLPFVLSTDPYVKGLHTSCAA